MVVSRYGPAVLPDRSRWPEPPPEPHGIPMQTFAWAYARAHVDPTEDIRVVSVADGDRIGALALLRADGQWLRELHAMWEPSDLMWSSPAALDELADRLAAQPRPIHLQRVPIDSPTLPALRRAYAQRHGRVLVETVMPTPYIELDERWRTDPDSCFSSRRRSDFRRFERRASELGDVSYEIRRPRTPEEMRACLGEAYEVEGRSWKAAEGSSLSDGGVIGHFFQDFADAALPLDMLRFAFLRIDGKAVAMQIYADWRDRIWLFKASHDEAFSRCSPGQLMMRHTLLDAADRGLRSYEFMGIMADWTKLWTDRTRTYVDIRALPISVPTGMMLVKHGIQSVGGRLGSDGPIRPLVKQVVGRPIKKVMDVAGRVYVPGERLDDALAVATRIAEDGLACTVGCFSRHDDTVESVATTDLAIVDAVADLAPMGYVSIKAPALRFDLDRTADIATRARDLGVIAHFDSHDIDDQDPTLECVRRSVQVGARVGLTLPGRWARSVADAEAVVRLGVRARVVKGEWHDPADPDRDARAGFLDIVDALAGRAGRIAVASHDAELVRESLRRLRDAGTPAELELLNGLPRRRLVAIAAEFEVPVRIYVPFGGAYRPYALRKVKENPRVLWWIARDGARGVLRR